MLRKQYIRVWWLLLIIPALLVGNISIFVNHHVKKTLKQFSKNAISQLEQKYQISMRYERLQLRSFRTLHIEQLSIQKEEQLVQIKSVKVYLNLLGFLSPHKSFNMVRLLEVNDVDVQIVPKSTVKNFGSEGVRQIRVGNRVSASDKTKAMIFYAFEALNWALAQKEDWSKLRLDIKRLNLTFKAPWGDARLENLYVSFRPRANFINFEMQTNVHSGLGIIKESFKTTAKGRISYQTQTGDASFELFPPKNLFQLKQHIKFQAHMQNGLVQIKKVEDTIPLDIVLKMDTKQHFFYALLKTRSFDFSQLVDFKTKSGQKSPWQNWHSHWTGNITFLYYPRPNLCYYDACGVFKTQTPHRETVLDLDISGDQTNMNMQKINFRHPGGNFFYQGQWNWQSFAPQGELIVHQNIQGRPFVLHLKVDEKNAQNFIQSQKFSFDGISLGTLTSTVSFVDKEYKTHIVYCTPQNKQIEAVGYFGKETHWGQWQLLASHFPLREWSQNRLLPSFCADWFLHWDMVLTIRPDGFFIDGRRLDFVKDAQHQVSAAFAVDNKRITLSHLMFVWGTFFTRFAAQTQAFSSQFTAQLNILDKEYQLKGYRAITGCRFIGPQGEWAVSWQEKNCRWNLAQAPIGTRNGETVALTSCGQMSWAKGFSFLMDKLLLQTPAESLMLEGVALSHTTGKIDTIICQDSFSRLTGQMGYRVYESNKETQVDGVLELSDGVKENYLLQFYYDKYWQGQLAVYGCPTERFCINGLEGPLNTTLTFNFCTKRPQINGYTFFDGFYKNRRVIVDTGLHVTEHGVRLLGSRLQYGKWRFLGPVLFANFDTGVVELSTQMTNISRKKSQTIRSGFTVLFMPQQYRDISSWKNLWTQDFTMRIQTQELVVNGYTFLPPYQVQMVRHGPKINVFSQKKLHLDLDYNTLEKTFQLDLLDDITKVSMRACGNLTENNYSWEISSFFAPLAMLNPLLILPLSERRILGFESGYAHGAFAVDNDHLMAGKVRVKGIALSPFSPGNSFKLRHDIQIHNNILRIQDWQFRLAYHTKAIINVLVNMSATNPTYTCRVDVQGGAGATFDFDIMNTVKFQGRVLGYTQFEGDARSGYLFGCLQFPTTKGSLGSLTKYFGVREVDEDTRIYKVEPPVYTIRSGRFPDYQSYGSEEWAMLVSKEESLMRSKSEEDRFRLVSGKDFTFYAPSMSRPTIQTTLNPGSYVDIFLDFTTNGRSDDLAYLQGILKINRGEINYFGNKFLVDQGGTITFDSETKFNPMVDLIANYRVDTVTNRIIKMHFHNQIFDTYSPEFKAEPSLPQEQIMAILGANVFIGNSVNQEANALFTGTTDDVYQQTRNKQQKRQNETSNALFDQNEGAFERVVRSGTDTIGTTLSRMMENTIKYIPFVNTVTVKTDFISNFTIAQLNRSILQDSKMTRYLYYQDGHGMNRYLDGTSLYLGSYLDKNLFFQTKIELKNNDFFIGYSHSNQLKVNLSFDFQISTPWCLVDWIFNPMQNSNIGMAHQTWEFNPEVTLALSRTIAFSSWRDFYRQLINEKEDE